MERITLTTVINPTTGEVLPGEIDFQVASLAGVSDGYHSIQDLYDHRITLYIALCRVFSSWEYDGTSMPIPKPWRSKLHHDGTAYEGWFILGMYKEKGKQITYHLPNSRWDDTSFAETLEIAPEFDGHTSKDVLERLKGV